jgi:hypothetical protein
MHCRPSEAARRARALIDRTRGLGGVLTLSWHERSLVPERQWDGLYRELLEALSVAGASIRPARDVVAWFRLRRAIDLESTEIDLGALPPAADPDIRIRLHGREGWTDLPARAEDLVRLLSPAEPAMAAAGPSRRVEKEVDIP